MDKPSFDFSSLTPDLILDGIESTGLSVSSGLTALNSYENRVYQFMDDERKRYVVKFYRPFRWSKEQINEEHQFVSQLQQADVPVIAPITINQSMLHEHQGYLFSVYPSAGGREYEIDNLDQLESVGRFLGRMHRVASKSTFEHRPVINLNEYLYQPREVLTHSELIPSSIKQPFFTALDELIATVEQYWPNDCQTIRLHGDCHAGNILWRDGPVFVDFDDARQGPAVQDLWLLLHGERQDQLLQLDILLNAYQEEMDFDLSQLKLIEPLRAMRMVHYLAWIVKRWGDPAFSQNFTWLKDLNFWHKQLSLFNEQVRHLHSLPLQLMNVY